MEKKKETLTRLKLLGLAQEWACEILCLCYTRGPIGNFSNKCFGAGLRLFEIQTQLKPRLMRCSAD